mmetsp:Transcript_14781/g.28983  ORF Transcript_14781/g.28983 Transcript_14781/m.28983 type:complete len:188 (-) Transcript_14781:37-600(-)
MKHCARLPRVEEDDDAPQPDLQAPPNLPRLFIPASKKSIVKELGLCTPPQGSSNTSCNMCKGKESGPLHAVCHCSVAHEACLEKRMDSTHRSGTTCKVCSAPYEFPEKNRSMGVDGILTGLFSGLDQCLKGSWWSPSSVSCCCGQPHAIDYRAYITEHLQTEKNTVIEIETDRGFDLELIDTPPMLI